MPPVQPPKVCARSWPLAEWRIFCPLLAEADKRALKLSHCVCTLLAANWLEQPWFLCTPSVIDAAGAQMALMSKARSTAPALTPSPEVSTPWCVSVAVRTYRSYRVASVRTLPQVPAGSMDYTTFSWKPFTARLKGMALSGAAASDSLNLSDKGFC
jgi:hypothetical protein